MSRDSTLPTGNEPLSRASLTPSSDPAQAT